MTKTLLRVAAACCAAPALALGPGPRAGDRQCARDGARHPSWSRASRPGDHPCRRLCGALSRRRPHPASPTARPSRHAAGGAIFGHGGVTDDTAMDGPAHEIVVELKDAPSNTVPNTTGLPPAFPARGSKICSRTASVRVWNYAWLPGKPTAMHFHDTEVVVVYPRRRRHRLAPPGRQGHVISHRNPGDIVFNLANRSHSEEVVKGQQSRHHAGAEIASQSQDGKGWRSRLSSAKQQGRLSCSSICLWHRSLPAPARPPSRRHHRSHPRHRLTPDQIQWKKGEANDTAWPIGDRHKPGACMELIKWHPGHFSHPHYHSHARYAVVIEGTWWVSTSNVYDPDHNTVPLSQGLGADRPGQGRAL